HRAVPVVGADIADSAAATTLAPISHARAVPGLFALLLSGLGLRLRGLVGGFRRFFAFGFLAHRVGAKRRPFAEAVFTDREQVALRVRDDHAHQVVTGFQFDAFHALGVAAH